MHRRLTAEQVESLGPRPELRRIEVTGGTNRDTRALYLANLSVYTEPVSYTHLSSSNSTRCRPESGESPFSDSIRNSE